MWAIAQDIGNKKSHLRNPSGFYIQQRPNGLKPLNATPKAPLLNCATNVRLFLVKMAIAIMPNRFDPKIKKGMKIELTYRQFELLLKLVFLGSDCHDVVEKPYLITTKECETHQLVNKLYRIAAETDGVKHLVDIDLEGKPCASEEFENQCNDLLDDAIDILMYEQLASELAIKELQRVYGKNVFDGMDTNKRLRLIKTVYEPYLEKLQKNDLDNIRLVL